MQEGEQRCLMAVHTFNSNPPTPPAAGTFDVLFQDVERHRACILIQQ